MLSVYKEYNILVVEDNPGDYTLVEEFLYEHIEAPKITHTIDFKTTKQILIAKQCSFDIIILDLSLPDKTGEPLINEIVNICSNTPIIVLTGYADFTFGVRSLSLGVSDYLLKEELTAAFLYKSIVYSSERKRAISSLEESEKRYSELFHFSPLPMWVTDSVTLQFLDVNLAAIKHYGYSEDEFLAMNVRDIKPPEELPELEQDVISLRFEDELYPQGFFKHRKKNGEIIEVDIQSSPIQYKGKHAKIILGNDVTERLKYIKAIEEQNKKLTEISWIQSHIIRAPLARIMGLIPLLMEMKSDDEEKVQILQYLKLSADELDDVIKNITNITKPVDTPTR